MTLLSLSGGCLIGGAILSVTLMAQRALTTVPGAAAVTSTALTAAPTGVPNTYALTATVTSGAGIPAGTVAFYDAGEAFQWLFALDSTGVAAITHNFFGGMHSFTAVFTPAGNLFAPSTSSVLSILIPAPPTTTVLSVSPSGGANQYVLTATVNFVKPGGISGTPPGRVNFYDNGTPLTGGNAPLLGTNTATAVVGIPSGVHSLTATFAPNQTYDAAPSTSPSVPLTVPATPTSTVLSAVPGNPVNQYSLKATVSSSPGTPSGTVTFYDSGVALPGSTTTLTNIGTAAFVVTLSPGNHFLTARYNPTDPSLFIASTSSAAGLAVPAITSTILSVTANPVGGQYTLVATVATLSPSPAGPPTGSVAFFDNGSALLGSTTSLNFGGTVTFLSPFPPGTHTLTAAFTSSNVQLFTSSTSPVVPLVVNRAVTSINVTSSPNPSFPGQSVKFTATLTGYTGTAAGTVQIVDGGQSLGVLPLVAGHATSTATLATTGTHDILVSYSGDTFNSDASIRFGQIVDRVTSSLTLTTGAAKVDFGQAVTFTATITPPPPAGVAVPSGTVQFIDGSILLGTSTVTSGAATLEFSHLAPGSHAIFATYSGDASWYGVRSSTLTVNSSAAATVTSLSSSGTISAVTLTAAIDPAVSVGTVQFFDSTTAAVLDNVKPVNGAASTVLTPAGAAALGGHTILVNYSGSGEYIGSSSSPLVMLALRNGAGGTSLSAAPDEWVSLYGSRMADVAQPVVASTPSQVLGGFSVNVTDSSGAVLSAALSYVSQSQINFLMPSNLAPGTVLVTLKSSGNVAAAVPVPSAPVAPGLFSASQIATSSVGDVYLVLYGTGIRHRTNIGQVTCIVSGTSLLVSYAGAQPSFDGLDQINVLLPADLNTSGTLSVSLIVDGQESNAISVVLQ
jgi:uncharacterized protein (TIGR03437 family)